MKSVIVGASGFLGAYLVEHLEGSEVIATSRAEKTKVFGAESWHRLDVNDFVQVKDFVSSHCDHNVRSRIFYLAACHHPDFVEENKSTAWQTNVTAYANFLNQLPASVDLVYVSTDNIYGEGAGLKAFAEQDQSLPLNEYGKQKLLAENLTLSRGHNVVRCSFLIGPSKTSKQHFYDQIVAALRAKKELELLADSYRSAISFNQVAEFLISLSNKFQGQQYGIVNIGGDDPLTKFDVGSLIAERENLSASSLLKIGYDDQSFFRAQRAKNIIIDNRKLKRLLAIESISLRF